MNKTLLFMALISAMVITGCKKKDDNNNNGQAGGKGNFLIGTTLRNPDGMSGSTYFQLVDNFTGTIDNSNGIQYSFGSVCEVIDNDIFIFSTTGEGALNKIIKYSKSNSTQLIEQGSVDLPINSLSGNISKVNESKAYSAMFNIGEVVVFNPATMQKTSTIDLRKYAYGDNNPEPGYGIIRDNYYYLPLTQVGPNYLPYTDNMQTDVAVIDVTNDSVVQIVSEKVSGLTFPTRPMIKDMIFTDEGKNIYIACVGFFGFDPNNKKNGFVCIPAGQHQFDPSKSWDISNTVIEGTTWKPYSIFNSMYIGSGKVAAFVCVSELSGPNPYTSRNAIAVIADLNAKTLKKIEGVPYTDGHSVFIGRYNDLLVFGAYGEDKAGFFTYNPSNEEVKHAVTTQGNPLYMHMFK